MLHEQADEDAAIAAVLLLGRVVHVDEAEGLAEQLGHLLGDGAAFELVDGGQAVVVEGDAVERADEQQRPVRAALGLLDVAAVVDRQEDVRRRAEVRQHVFQRQRVRRVHQHERHAGAQQRDGCPRVGFELLMLEVFFPKYYGIVSQPVIPYAVHIQLRQYTVRRGSLDMHRRERDCRQSACSLFP